MCIRDRSRADHFVACLLGCFFEIADTFFYVAHIYIAVTDQARDSRRDHVVAAAERFQQIQCFFIVAHLEIADTGISLCQVTGRCASVLVDDSFESFIIRTVSVQCQVESCLLYTSRCV